MNKRLIIATLITSLTAPGTCQAQTDDTILKRSRAAGIAAVLNCHKHQGDGEENKLIRLLENEGLRRQTAWLKTEKGRRAIELVKSETLSRDCTKRTNINQEDLGEKLYLLLIDADIASDDDSETMEELQYLFTKAREEDLAGETLKSLKTRKKMLELADKVEITKASHGSIYMGVGKDYMSLGKPEKAVGYLVAAEELLRESLGELHQTTSLAIIFHAEAIFESGNRKKGLSKLQDWTKRLNKETERMEIAEMKIIAFRTLASLRLMDDDVEGLRSATHQAKRLIRKFRGKDHQSLLLFLNMEALSYRGDKLTGITNKKNNLKRESLFKETVDISEKHGNKLEQSTAYMNLGTTQMELGKFDLAEASILKSLRLHEASSGKTNKEYVFRLSGLNTLYVNTKNLGGNLATSLELKAITRKVYGEKSFEYARRLISTSNAYNSVGQHDEAFNEAMAAYLLLKNGVKASHQSIELAIRSAKIALRNTKKWRDPEDIIDATNLTLTADELINKESLSLRETINAGNAVMRLLSEKKWEQAHLLSKRQIKSYKLHLEENHKIVLGAKKTSADILSIISPTEAIKELLDIESVYTRTYSGDNLAIAQFYKSLAFAYWKANQRSEEDNPLQKSVLYTLKYLQETVPTLGDSQRLRAAITYSLPLNFAYTGAHQREKRAELAYLTYINQKGMLSEIEKASREIHKNNRDAESIISKIQALNTQLSKPNLKNSDAERIERERTNLQLNLNKSLKGKDIRLIKKEEIAKSLDKASILIELQKYWRMEILEQDEGDFYHAYILKPNGALNVVQLGEARKIDQKISQLRNSLQNQTPEIKEISESISETIFEPLKKYGIDGKTIYITLDSDLQAIPVSLIRDYFGEGTKMRLISTSKDLIRLKKPSHKSTQKSVVISNPTFDLELKRTPVTTQATKFSNLRGWNEIIAWQPLPGTKKEGEKVNQLLRGLHLYEDEATSNSVLGVSSPKILHIATHGFYFPSTIEDKSNNDLLSPKYNQLDNPLIRSGIVLAGANNPANYGEDDGILTALELLSLDLDGTKLVTLSACDTGRGDNVPGEGLFGLQRALNVAGARSMILSLWQVDDNATAAFMTYFYKEINKGIELDEALFNTQSYFKEHPIPAWRHPFYWSAFQLIGDWRAIDL